MKQLNINDVKISRLGHASFRIEHNSNRFFIDPYEIQTDEKADVILITHGHYDHCSIADISRLTTPATKIITTPDTTSKLASKVRGGKPILIKPGDKLELKDEQATVEAVPAYNLEKTFHPKDNQWVGYVLTINGIRIYHTGDTDFVPELKDVKADIVLVPVGGTYTMDAVSAASLINTIKPKLAIPMHYGKIIGSSHDAEKFKGLVKCAVRLLD